jgi:hypothetical protein
VHRPDRVNAIVVVCVAVLDQLAVLVAVEDPPLFVAVALTLR